MQAGIQEQSLGVKALPFSLHPFIYGSFRQWVGSIQSFVSLLRILLTQVPAYCPRLYNNPKWQKDPVQDFSPFSNKSRNKTKRKLRMITEYGDVFVLKCRYLTKGLRNSKIFCEERRRKNLKEKADINACTWILRKSGLLCSPLDMLTGISWN